MVDISVISGGLASIKTALAITKELRNIDSSLKDAEVKLKLADIVEALSDAKISLSEARDENEELKQKIKILEGEIVQTASVVFKDGHYYREVPSVTGQADGPFCANCFSSENKLIPVSKLPKDFHDMGKYSCPSCGSITI